MPAIRVCFLLAHSLPSYMTLVLFDNLRQGHLRLGQPEGHVQVTVEREGGRELSAGLFPLATLAVAGREAARSRPV